MSTTVREREARLPMAEYSYPTCGNCTSETAHDGDGLVCYDCGIDYSDDLSPSLRDPDSPACEELCDNVWHKPGALWPGRTFDCNPCILAEGHVTSEHYNGCLSRDMTPEESAALAEPTEER